MLDKKNSTIFKNPEDPHLINLTLLGTISREDTTITIEQEDHCFQIGDVLYYDIKNLKFGKALAINTMEGEVCGIVSEVTDQNRFVLITEGKLVTDRYKYLPTSPLFLSEVIPGTLMSIPPTSVSKQVAVQVEDGIQVDIHMGYYLGGEAAKVGLEPYTKEELDEIILNVKG